MGSSVADETPNHTEELSLNHTGLVKEATKQLIKQRWMEAEKLFKKLILKLGIRGVITMLGLRKTIGS